MNAFHWNTGEPSIFRAFSSHAKIAEKSRAALEQRTLRIRPDLSPRVKRHYSKRKWQHTCQQVLAMNFQAVAKYRALGHTWNECMDAFPGVCVKTMRKHVLALNPDLEHVTVGRTGGLMGAPSVSFDEAKARQMLDGGMSYGQVAKALQVAKATLYKRFNKGCK